ncbi:Ribosome biogenesis protein NOP53 [Eumeta japonica]|uniref:Ribosome biogenesis protein NOP53 n=1 Tax=Eumeta variegata TaxID=151549 RepID=A0A4C1UR33_EUMVA|nr:Ribosome biogenesis protein NOP53 [Eumeta japonica]
MSIVKKKRHVSKKNKKAWRKYCDIQDVEDFLDDQRLEERLGKFETKPDSELFVFDTTGEESKNDENEEKKPIITLKYQRRMRLTETPKCFDVLLPNSKVPDPVVKRNHVKPVGSKPTALSKISHKKKLEKGIYEKKIMMNKKNRKIALERKKKSKQKTQNFNLDLWGQDTPEVKGIPETLCEEFISPEAQIHNVLPEKRFRVKPPPPKKLMTKSAVETPHPGISYNPSYQEHQDLLQKVVEREQKLIKKEKHLERVTTRMFSKVSAQDKENQWKSEMSVGLLESEPSKLKPSNPDEDTDNEYRAINPPVKNKKKDHKARRKQKERLAEMERLKREKINKKKISDIYRLRKLKSVIEKTESKQVKEREQRAKKRALKEEIQPPTLSSSKIPLPEPDFVEPSALTGDLRNVECKGTGNLLRERYESLQRRGALAGAKVMMKKKKKIKSYFKPGHKVTDQDVQNYLAKIEQ